MVFAFQEEQTFIWNCYFFRADVLTVQNNTNWGSSHEIFSVCAVLKPWFVFLRVVNSVSFASLFCRLAQFCKLRIKSTKGQMTLKSPDFMTCTYVGFSLNPHHSASSRAFYSTTDFCVCVATCLKVSISAHCTDAERDGVGRVGDKWRAEYVRFTETDLHQAWVVCRQILGGKKLLSKTRSKESRYEIRQRQKKDEHERGQLTKANSVKRPDMCWLSVPKCKQPAGHGNQDFFFLLSFIHAFVCAHIRSHRRSLTSCFSPAGVTVQHHRLKSLLFSGKILHQLWPWGLIM